MCARLIVMCMYDDVRCAATWSLPPTRGNLGGGNTETVFDLHDAATRRKISRSYKFPCMKGLVFTEVAIESSVAGCGCVDG